MPLDLCKRRLASLWFISSGFLFAFVLLQTALGHYRGVENEAWGWLFANLLPTLSLMVGVFVLDVRTAIPQAGQVSSFVFHLTFWLSAAYLLVILLTLILPAVPMLLQTYTAPSSVSFMKLGQQLWLSPFQGLVAASLGAFFVKK